MAMSISNSRAYLVKLQCHRISLRCASSSSTTIRIPPESPKYIEIPQSPQQQAYRKPQIKGVLPVPRKIFHRKAPDRTAPEYLAAVTREPTTLKDHSSAGPPHVKELADWKSRQAATRRSNLRESLVELRARKMRSDRRRDKISAFKTAEHQRKIHEPEREDERLTNPSILNALTPGSSNILIDPGREERIAMKKARHEKKEQEKIEERRHLLHSLYMNARDFIVTEEAWNAKVDEVFDEDWYKVNPERSVWDREGFPNTTQSILKDSLQYEHGSSLPTNAANQRRKVIAEITHERAQRIAEELTGGKM